MDNYPPLEIEDLSPYSPESFEVVGRIHKNGKWFIGEVIDLAFTDSSTLKVRFGEIAELEKNSTGDIVDELDKTIVTVKDIPQHRSFSQCALPFGSITYPERLVSDKIPDDVLFIRFAGGFIVISKRPSDLLAIKEILGRAAK